MELEVLEIDHMGTDLVNTVLKRRNLYLKTLKPKPCLQLLMPFRSSDVLGDKIV